jgi:uncharacterized protein YyaL (SSP411 family)
VSCGGLKPSGWKVRRSKILTALRQAAEPGQAGESPGPAVLAQVFQDLLGGFDREQGGFGGAPKFPAAHTLSFLLTRREPEALGMVEKTLRAMRAGGIYDQVGLGFHRYATDARWRVPHFEKMLYDQALLALAYTEAWQLTGQPLYRRTAEETFTYVLRDLTSPEGAFYSAEDADSEGEEGRFYRWTREELSSLLEAGELALVGLEEGTLHLLDPERPLGRIPGACSSSRRARAPRKGRQGPGELERPDDRRPGPGRGSLRAAGLRAGRRARGAFRAGHPARPGGRAAAPLARRAGGHPRLRRGLCLPGLGNAGAVPGRLRALGPGSGLRADRPLAGTPRGPAGGFFQARRPINGRHRLQPTGDWALPSANSVALRVLVRLSRIGDRPAYWKAAEGLLRRHSAMVRRHPQGFTFLLAGLDFYLGPSSEVVLAGRAEGEDTAALARALRRAFLPRAVFLLSPTGQADPAILRLAPFARGYGEGPDGQAQAFVCRNYSCRLPTGDAQAMLALLAEP